MVHLSDGDAALALKLQKEGELLANSYSTPGQKETWEEITSTRREVQAGVL
jgi:hypothetical protein